MTTSFSQLAVKKMLDNLVFGLLNVSVVCSARHSSIVAMFDHILALVSCHCCQYNNTEKLNLYVQVWRDLRRLKLTPSSRPRNKWRSEKSMTPWTTSKQTRLNHTNHQNPQNQLYYLSPRNTRRPHRPHLPLLVTLLPPPRGKWFPRPKVMYPSSRPRQRQATGSMPPYLQLSLLFRVNKCHRRLLIIWSPGSEHTTVAPQCNRMELTVTYEQSLVCVLCFLCIVLEL